MDDIPIYRAKKLGSDEEIDGYYQPKHFSASDESEEVAWLKHFEDCLLTRGKGFIEIDPSTLKISFDNGKTWNTILDVKGVMGFHNATR